MADTQKGVLHLTQTRLMSFTELDGAKVTVTKERNEARQVKVILESGRPFWVYDVEIGHDWQRSTRWPSL